MAGKRVFETRSIHWQAQTGYLRRVLNPTRFCHVPPAIESPLSACPRSNLFVQSSRPYGCAKSHYEIPPSLVALLNAYSAY